MAFAADTFASGTASQNLTARTASDGGTWAKVGSGTDMISGSSTGVGAHPSSAAEFAPYYHSGTPASANYSVQCNVYTASSSGVTSGPAGRISTSAQTCYFVRLSAASSGTWELYSQVSGTETMIGSYVGDGYVSGVTLRVCKLEMIGAQIKVYIDGTLRISVINSSITAAGKAGIGGYYANGTDGSYYISAFTASDIVTNSSYIIQSQTKNVVYPAGSTSDSVTLSGVTAGSTLVAITSFLPSNGNNGETASISSDSSGQTWPSATVSRTSINTPYASGLYAWVLPKATAGTHTVNFSYSNNGSYWIILLEISPSAADSSGVTNTSGSQTTLTATASSALSSSQDLVIAAIGGISSSGTVTNMAFSDPPSGYTSIIAWNNETTNYPGEIAYKIASSSSAPSASWTWSAGGYMDALVLALVSTDAKIKMYANGAFQASRFIEGAIV